MGCLDGSCCLVVWSPPCFRERPNTPTTTTLDAWFYTPSSPHFDDIGSVCRKPTRTQRIRIERTTADRFNGDSSTACFPCILAVHCPCSDESRYSSIRRRCRHRQAYAASNTSWITHCNTRNWIGWAVGVHGS